jgi:hypothetical protein
MIVDILSDLPLKFDIYSADQEILHFCEPGMLFLPFTNLAPALYTNALEVSLLQCLFL